jgi:hypothetical protein
MNTTPQELARLAREVARYLAAVDAFRREGCEPVWRSERSEPPCTPPHQRLAVRA